MLVIPDQIIDYTHGRAATYCVGGDKPVTHLDFTFPYCNAMRAALLQAATSAGISLRDGGVYGAVQGRVWKRLPKSPAGARAMTCGMTACRKRIWHVNWNSVTPRWCGGELCGRARLVVEGIHMRRSAVLANRCCRCGIC